MLQPQTIDYSRPHCNRAASSAARLNDVRRECRYNRLRGLLAHFKSSVYELLFCSSNSSRSLKTVTMPLPNELFGRSLVNLGPLTSTYTLPDDCATPTNVYLVAADEIGTGAIWQSECSTEELATVKWRSTCFPSGSALDSIYRSADLDLPAQTILAYFSPGIACPDAWVTVGVAVKDDKGEISSSGQFVIPDVLATAPVPPYNPAPNIFMDAIENGETVAICCPRSV